MGLKAFEIHLESLFIKYSRVKETENNSAWTKHTSTLLHYMKQVPGWTPGAPYCAAAVGGAIIATMCKLGHGGKVGAFNKLHSASCMTNVQRAAALGILRTVPKPYAIMLFRHGDSWRGHEAMVQKEVWRSGKVSTMEGNTDSGGSREGDGFYPKLRHPSRNGSLIVQGYVWLEDILDFLDIAKSEQAKEYFPVVDVEFVPAYVALDQAKRLDLLSKALKLEGAYYSKQDALTYVPRKALNELLRQLN